MAFSFRAGTNWCHDFPKLARESGFYFNMHGSRVRVDWNRISAIDIDRVIRERDFLTIDANINNVVDYCLESEYDVKILDPNFVKLFRLAQLSVEYLLYCKQYLDHSVIILKDELRQKIEQNVSMKKEVATLEDTLKNLKERSREKRKLIETSFGEMASGEIYKCPHCPKTFVRAIFVNAHIARKHSYISNIGVSTSPAHEHYRAETEKLHNEIKTLKERLNQTERVIRNESDKILDNTEKMYIKNNRGEQDKVDMFQEQRRHQEDIGNLKSMLFDEIRALKEKDHTVNESILETNVKTLISQQEKEIEGLRNQLLERLTPDVENMQVKLQTQENYWKAKIEDMESAHHRDIERLTTELKVTQQVADHIKSEYSAKVHDLEKQSMDQSNMLIEQRKQLNSLSREMSNSQTQINNYRIREKDKIEKFHESPILRIKHDNSYNNSETYHKSSNSIRNGEMVIEDIGSECSQDNDKSIAMQSKCVPNKNDTIESRNNRKFIIDLSRTTEHVTAMSNLRNLERLDVRKTKDKIKHYNTLDDENEIIDYTSKSFTSKGNIPTNVYKKYADIKNVERKRILHNDMRNSKNSKFLEKQSVVNSATESVSSSSMSESESETESVTADDDIVIEKYETSVVKSSNAKNLSIEEEVQIMFNNRLRELGIDPEWRGIPAATFKQKMEIVKHQQNINTKKLAWYAQIKQTILEDLFQKISTNHKESKYTMLTKHSPFNKLIPHTKSKALKAFSDHKNNDESVQKTENTTPSKLRLKQKIELLPKKYKDNEAFENTHESPSKRNGIDGSTPKVTPTYPRLMRNISSSSSIESEKDIKQISSTKITVSDSGARKISSPISRKQVIAPKFAENNDSDSAIVQQDDSILSLMNNKSVLKPMSGSVGSLVKKKVLFDLEDTKVDFDDTTIPENDQRTQITDDDWNISSFPERDEYALRRQKSMSTSNIILKTSQSDKIAEISKKIQEQLSIARKPPVGSVETIFRSSTNLQDLTNFNANNRLSSSLTGTISESPLPNFTSTNTKSSVFPQPAPRTRKDTDLTVHREHELKYSDLDSDIDEILQME
nr:PREDICTED: zinc finger protein DZIP1L isoform X1 [Linepithema humile]